MEDNKNLVQRDILPDNFESLEEFWQFWDTHSTADYEDFMEDVEVEIELPRRKLYFSLAQDLLVKVRDQARRQGISAETLINLWVQEKVYELA